MMDQSDQSDQSDPSASWTNSPAVAQQVAHLLGQLSLADKIDLVSGRLAVTDAGAVPTMPAGLPVLALADGPAGVRVANPTLADHRATALPAPIALAATWSPELARRYGAVLGAEAAATGHNIFLGPAVDIARVPQGGRTFESFGEDPLLQARLVAAEIQALQAHAVVACVKHFLANNQEYQRGTVDVAVDERTLQEIYLPPFAAAVHEGRAGAVMASYNKINGVHACENRTVLTEILRGQLGFRGFVMSDYLANPSTAGSANAGLDWELGARMWGPRLLEAVESGAVAVAALDEMVRRILLPLVGLGLAGQPRQVRSLPVQEHSAEALAIAEQAIVLLKNDGGLLPLAAETIRAIAVIGPDADNVAAAGGGSGYVQPACAVSVLEGIRRRAGAGVRVDFAPGVDPIGPGVLLPGAPAVPSGFFTPAGEAAGSGLRVEYWDNPHFAGAPVTTRVEPRAELNYGFFDLFPGLRAASPRLPARPAGLPGRMAVRWSGALTVPVAGEYTFHLTCLGSARFDLDGQELLNSENALPVAMPHPRLPMNLPAVTAASAVRAAAATVHLAAGVPHAVVVEYAADAPGTWIFGEALLRLGWQPPAAVRSPTILEAAAVARQVDVAVVVVRTYETEEMDRPDLRLPNDQDLLIRAVAAANPRTVVVLMNAGPVVTAPWEDDVSAVVEAWYGGQEQGAAVARVLFGDVNPAGRLPLTFPCDEAHTPVATTEQYPGIDGVVHYAEGMGVGYRGYERLGIAPHYPFGYGLSYTRFDYANLDVSPTTADDAQVITVSFDLTNAGTRAGIEIAQVYIGLPAHAAAPLKRLAGWARVELPPGETRRVAVTLDPRLPERPLSFWNPATHDWEIPAGEFAISVGASAQDIRLTGRLTMIDSR
jgi:beta-glucosidase